MYLGTSFLLGTLNLRVRVQDITQDIQAALPADKWFQENQNILSQRDRLAWKGSKMYVPKILQREATLP